MQRLIILTACSSLLFGLGMTAQAEPPSPAKNSAGPAVHTLTIRGKATDHERKVVAGAKVFLLTANRVPSSAFRPTVAETITDAAGAYTFEKVSLPLDIYPQLRTPSAKLVEGTFQVYGTADGYGFTWHKKLSFSTEARPNEDARKDLTYAGEDAAANLEFDLPARVSGQMISDNGKPLVGVKVQLGYCDDPRRPHGYGSWMCRFLGKNADDASAIPFDGIKLIPEKHRSAVTDDKGRYEINGLRRDTHYLAQIDPGPHYDSQTSSVATSPKEAGNGIRSLGYDGELFESFKAPWLYSVQVITRQGQPLAGVQIRARGDRVRRAGNFAKTDAEGRATLVLHTGDYKIILEPPFGSLYALTEHETTVSQDTAAEPHSLILDDGGTLIVTAVEEGSGKPVPGVRFLEEIESGKLRRELQSQTVFVDHPSTDERGELQAIAKAGETRLIVSSQPIGYEPVNKFSEVLSLKPQQSTTTTFTFKRTTPPATIAKYTFVPEEEGEIGKLNALILRQQKLGRTGRLEVKSHFRPVSGITVADFQTVLRACRPDQAPDLPALLRKKNPDLEFPFGHQIVTVDGERIRQESFDALADGSEVHDLRIFNGVESVDFGKSNAQASVHSYHAFAVGGLTRWRPIYKIKSPPVGDEVASRKISHASGRMILETTSKSFSSRMELDERTGFLFYESQRDKNGELQQELWQFAPQETPSGAIFAGLIVEPRYSAGKVELLGIHEVKNFTSGKPSPERFVLSAPAGTMIVDSRGNSSSPKIGVVSEPVTDVIMRANQISDDARSILPVIKIGQAAPPIEPALWLNASGKTEKLDWKGKVLLVDFWGTSCGPCVAELPSVQEFAVKFEKAGGVVLGLHEGSESADRLSEFARKRGLTYQLAIDKPEAASFGATFKAYGIGGIPNCAVIDQRGNVAYVGHFEEAAVQATRLLEAGGK
jgi:peroxiredoxin